MEQIKCPHCGEVFTIDESNYESIVKQVRDQQFNSEVKRAQKEYEQKLEAQLALAREKAANENQRSLNEKDLQIEKLKSQLSDKEKEKELYTREAVDKMKEELQEKENRIISLAMSPL